MQVFIDSMLKVWYLWAILLVLLALTPFIPKIKGFLGELDVSNLLLKLPQEQYIPLNNIMLKTPTGTTQIDHILVSIYGIFVIETKNYKGLILGRENDKQWTQCLSGQKNRFMNPIRQNFGHIQNLKALLRAYGEIPYISIVAFEDNCRLILECPKAIVIKFGQLRKTVKDFSIKPVMNLAKAIQISHYITTNNIDSKENRKTHVAMIQEKKAAAKNR